MVAKIFGDKAWLEKYIKLVRKRLTISNAAVVDALKAIDVPCFEGAGTLSVWADFRKYLKAQTWEAEGELWEELFNECKWLITKGE